MKKPSIKSIFIVLLLLTLAVAQAEPSLEQRIDVALKMLQKNKSDYWKLTGEIETHIKNKVTNVADRQLIGLFKILGRHQQLNEDLAKIDAKLEQAYQKWRKENPGYHRSDWQSRGLERNTNLQLNTERSQLWSQYIHDQGHYRHDILTGKDGVLKGLQNRQQQLIQERKRLTQLLRELQLELAEDLKQPLTFHIIGDLTRWVSAGSKEVVEIMIAKGKPPFNLQYRTAKDGLVDITLNSTGKHSINLNFDKASEAGLIIFKLEDNQLPKNFRSESIAFIFTGDDKEDESTKPDKKPDTTKEENKEEKVKPSYDEIVLKNECEQLDPSSQEWQEKCQPRKPDDPLIEDTLSFEFTCGDAFELSPNDVLYPKTCDVLVKSTGTTAEKIELSAIYNKELLDVTFDNQTQAAQYPVTRFLLIIRTKPPVPAVLTTLTIIVKHGSLEGRKEVTVSILLPGIEPSSGNGIRPPAVVETGSGGSYCVWRNKSFGDKPKCFNISTAECDNPRYSGVAKYELVGSGLSKAEAALRAYTLSPYKGNFYGCDHFGNDPSQVVHDRDNDSIPDATDNCPDHANKDQTDSDSNNIGDVCDKNSGTNFSNDDDKDTIINSKDNCPNTYNPKQLDSDKDGQGDACQTQTTMTDISKTDCSAYPGTVAVWVEETQTAGCSCTGKDDWSDKLNRCASKTEDVLANTDCTSFGNAKAVYDGASGQGMCECLKGYDFDANNKCMAIIIDENCQDFPGTIYSNNQCQCPGSQEWSDTKNQCVDNADLAQNDVDCTAYPGSAPEWDVTSNNWKCECIGNKQWSSALKACAYPEDEAVAASDCSSFKGTVAVFDDFTGAVECKCIHSGLVLSNAQNTCMTADAAAVADHDCSSFGIGGIAYLNPSTNQGACQCKGGFEMNSTGDNCQANTTVAGPVGQTVLPTPEIIKPGQCDVLYDDGSDQPESYVFNVVGFSRIKLNYDTDSIKDNISVLTSSRSEIWRSGCVGTGSYNTQIIDLPTGASEVIIDVHPNCDGTSTGTSWKFKAECL